MGNEFAEAEIIEVRLDEIEPMPIKIRKMDREEKILLVRSIRENKYVEPIQVCKYTVKVDWVRRDPPFYLIVNGQHRFEVIRDVFAPETIKVVLLGENWDEAKYWTEAIRLNNIRGDYDLAVLADRVKFLASKLDKANEGLREVLGFTSRDKIFMKTLKALGRYIPEEKKKQLKEKVEKGMSYQELTTELQNALTMSRLARADVLVLVSAGNRFMIVNVSEDLFNKLANYRTEVGDAEFYRVLTERLSELG
ncbi:MAG: ParB/RepB/Spo0J family partition protein [Candidatus Caldarchaeum sp.]